MAIIKDVAKAYLGWTAAGLGIFTAKAIADAGFSDKVKKMARKVLRTKEES